MMDSPDEENFDYDDGEFYHMRGTIRRRGHDLIMKVRVSLKGGEKASVEAHITENYNHVKLVKVSGDRRLSTYVSKIV